MVLGPLLGENAGSDSGGDDVWVAEGYAYRTSMQPGTPRFSGGETTSRPNIDNVWPIFGRFFRELSLQADSNPGGANFYLSLIYLKLLPELGLALPLQRKQLSDVMAADN